MLQNMAKHLSYLYDKYVVRADKSKKNIMYVCKLHYIHFLINEEAFDNSQHIPPGDVPKRKS